MNHAKEKVPMPLQEPKKRITNFQEVALGYTREQAMLEADRCLHCRHKPCVAGCPVSVKIPDFIGALARGNEEEAYEILKSTNALPAVCGRVCPQETQCELRCVRGIKGEPVAIGRLERYAADAMLGKAKSVPVAADKERVAVIGGGPAGLSCAGSLAALGYKVTVFEIFSEPGGVLVYGIPEFRLPKEIVKAEVDALRAVGVEFQTNMVIGKVLTIDELFESGYAAAFVATGAGLPVLLNIPGENLAGVYTANEFLTRINLMKAYKDEYDTPILPVCDCVVVGGGNVAMDAARAAKRLGARRVTVLYRRTEKEMPARLEEIEHAKEEEIEFFFMAAPLRLEGENGRLVRVVCERMEMGAADATGRQRPIPVPDSEFVMEADTLITAIGNTPNPLVRQSAPRIEANKKGCLVVDPITLATSQEGVYAGGDAVSGAATVILAMGAGRQAATSIDAYLTQKRQ